MKTPRSLVLALLLTLATVAASGQEIEALAGVRLHFDRAGARQLAIGGTGIALQDPSAARMNPAALAGASPALSIEGGRRSVEGRYITGANLETRGVESATRGASSVSLTMPLAGLTWSFFYDEPVDVEHSTAGSFDATSVAAFLVCDGRARTETCPGTPIAFRLPATFPLETSLRLKRYGAAAAWERGPVAIGAAVQREALRQRAAFVSAATIPADGVSESTDDTDVTWSAGLNWKVLPRASVGATYASGGSFRGSRSFSEIPSRGIEFRTPSSFGAGIAVDVLPNLTVAADALRVRYSTMMHAQRALEVPHSALEYPDVTELHAGAEYRKGSLAMRVGYWRDPAHSLTIPGAALPPPPFHYVAAIVDADENHMTGGIGFGSKTRFDVSIDRGPRSTHLLVGVTRPF